MAWSRFLGLLEVQAGLYSDVISGGPGKDEAQLHIHTVASTQSSNTWQYSTSKDSETAHCITSKPAIKTSEHVTLHCVLHCVLQCCQVLLFQLPKKSASAAFAGSSP